MHEADRIAQDNARKAAAKKRSAAQREADQVAAYRNDVLRQIRELTPQVLDALKAKGYPDSEALTFQRKKTFGRYQDEIRAGWALGKFFLPESHTRGEGYEPLHLLANGHFAAFGHLELTFEDFSNNSSATWWRRRAPESILDGLRRLQDRYSR